MAFEQDLNDWLTTQMVGTRYTYRLVGVHETTQTGDVYIKELVSGEIKDNYYLVAFRDNVYTLVLQEKPAEVIIQELKGQVETYSETLNNMLISDSYGTVYQRLKGEYIKGNITANQIYKDHYRTHNYISDSEWAEFYTEILHDTFQRKVDKKLTDLEIWAHGVLSLGYTPPGESFALALFNKDILEFTKMLGMLNETLAQGFVQSSTNFMILDKDGVPHQKTVAELKTILALYGIHAAKVWATHSTYEATIKSLPDTEEGLATLNAIEFSLG